MSDEHDEAEAPLPVTKLEYARPQTTQPALPFVSRIVCATGAALIAIAALAALFKTVSYQYRGLAGEIGLFTVLCGGLLYVVGRTLLNRKLHWTEGVLRGVAGFAAIYTAIHAGALERAESLSYRLRYGEFTDDMVMLSGELLGTFVLYVFARLLGRFLRRKRTMTLSADLVV